MATISSIHPFLVDQTPFLPHALTNRSPQSCRSHTHNPTSPRKSFESHHTTSSTSSSIGDAGDLRCVQFMARAAEAEHLFGSVARRSSKDSVEEKRRKNEEAARKESEMEALRLELEEAKTEKVKGCAGFVGCSRLQKSSNVLQVVHYSHGRCMLSA